MPVAYRPGTAADAEAVHRVTIRAIEALAAAVYTDAQREAWATNFDPDSYPLDDSAFQSVVAERTSGTDEAQRTDDSSDETQDGPQPGEIVGYGILDTDPNRAAFERPVAAEVLAVYVHPAAAGSGIGPNFTPNSRDTLASRGPTRLDCGHP